MANFTEKAIKESFIRLLKEKPLSKITVKDIVEDCGINRNSFYYHYQDVPQLLNCIIADEADRLIEAYPTIESREKAFDVAVEFALENKAAVMHLYNSENRDVLERNILKLSEDTITKYMKSLFPEQRLNDQDRKIVINVLKCEVFGMIIEWLERGMSEDIKADYHRFNELMPRLIEEAGKLTGVLKDESAAAGKAE